MSENVSCTVFLSPPRLALCISDCDPRAPRMPLRMFLLWKSQCEKVGWRVTAKGCVWVLLSLCVLVFFLLLWVLSWIPQNSEKVSSPTSFSPLFDSFLFSPHSLFLCFTSWEITFYCLFPVPEEREIKSLLGLGGSVKIA